MPVPWTCKAATADDFKDWQQLMSTVSPGSRFLSPIWFQSWESTLLDSGNWQGPVNYIMVRLDGRLSGVLPLAIQRFSIFRFLSLPGYYIPFRDLPVEADKVYQVVDTMVCRMARVKGIIGARIGPTENGSPTLLALKGSFRHHGWTIIEKFRGKIFYLELPKNIVDYVPIISGRAKKANYYLRRLKKIGDVSMKVKRDLSSNEWQETFRELQKIESESWVAESGEPRFLGENNFRFWKSLLQGHELRKVVKVWMLYLDGEPVSFCLVLDTGPIRYQLINGYSKSVKQHSTGHILFKEMIFDAIETGVERICFGQGDPGHKGEWGAKPSVELIDLVAIKPGLFSKLASLACSITNGARQMLRAAKRYT